MTAVRSRKQPISQPEHSGKWSRNPLYSHNLIEAGSERESSEGEKEKRERKERDRERERDSIAAMLLVLLMPLHSNLLRSRRPNLNLSHGIGRSTST